MLLLAMASQGSPWQLVSASQVAEVVRHGRNDELLLIDSRSFLEYNTHHICGAINVCCSKLVKRRLQQDKVSVRDLLAQACTLDASTEYNIIVYDQCTSDPVNLAADCFLMVLLRKLVTVFDHVALLKGGFLEFQATHPSLCDTKSTSVTSSGNYKCPPLTSMSQPCLPVSNIGPTKILPFLYLGSQTDALSEETMKVTGINYCLNVSTTCPKSAFIQDSYFLRIPVNDNYSDKLLPYFQDAFQFLDKVREANGCVIVHCLAGISRSPTLAIAYIMRYLNLSTDDAYRYVKDKRPTISPNFNFLGQLLEYEKQLKQEGTEGKSFAGNEGAATCKRICIDELRSPSSPTIATPKPFLIRPAVESTSVQSPTTALAKLSFGGSSGGSATTPTTPETVAPPTPSTSSSTSSSLPASASSPSLVQSGADQLAFPHFPTTSLDQLNFTPCFASAGEKTPRLASMAPTLGLSDPPKQAGTKRPLSFHPSPSSRTESSSSPGSSSPMSSESSSTPQQALTATQVNLRSPETKAKRPLVRPNSIAFSTYPKYDFLCVSSDSSVSPHASPAGEEAKLGGEAAAVSALPLHPHSKTDEDQGAKNSSSQVLMRPSSSTPGNMAATRQFEQGRKSRSLEDILNSPDEEALTNPCSCGAGSFCKAYKRRGLHGAMDMFPQSVALDRHCRCRGVSDAHQSSSSISSSGSHNSLHGSLDFIQVS